MYTTRRRAHGPWFQGLASQNSTRLLVGLTKPTLKSEYLNQLLGPYEPPRIMKIPNKSELKPFTTVNCSNNKSQLFLFSCLQESTTRFSPNGSLLLRKQWVLTYCIDVQVMLSTTPEQALVWRGYQPLLLLVTKLYLPTRGLEGFSSNRDSIQPQN